ncbi:MAG: NUDIX domain-containing protein [Nannocystaceae bacterium]
MYTGSSTEVDAGALGPPWYHTGVIALDLDADPRLIYPGDARLAPIPELGLAVAYLTAAPEDDPDVAQARAAALAFVGRHPDALLRTCLQGHVTCSALLVDHACARGLLLLHRKHGRWLQPGGHADGDGNLAHVAARELVEETGLTPIELLARPIAVDVHEVAPRGEAPHLHLDVRFVARASADAAPVANDEAAALRWFDERALVDPSGPLGEGGRRLARRGFAAARARFL